MMIAQRIDRNAGKKVGIGLAVQIIERGALAAHKAHRRALTENLQEMLAVQRLDFGKVHGKDLRG